MRLNPFNPGSINVRRGGGGGGLPGGGAGLGCGGIVIVLVAALLFGVDPAQMLGTMDTVQPQSGQITQGQSQETDAEICDDSQYLTEACNALASLDQTWAPEFQQAGIAFRQPTLVPYQGGTRSGCGAAQASMGPFYCPADEGIYIDTSFYDTMNRQLGARGDFARYYVIAHEYGHHVQKLTGIAGQVQSAMQANPRQANALSVRLELQADCYAGVWAGKNRNLIEPGDFEEGMTAANAIGDDTLTQGQVSPDNFTHGTSQQRMQALRLGMESGDSSQCDRIIQG
ncbi:zinc metalloprotease [Altererythrobacter salegens]|uniref:Zinc metalloprotease n=1 Tax=Croceibacterium salegens TaxID=1737568 RepID=A0A6I4SRY0_9SPHN|nr:neutral zinc metallopeptidase [Croceibacterium salegens]MXO58674.1 zinc metalloprotease [Croceibacterium salegens]